MQMAILLRGGALGDSSFRLCSLTSTSSFHVSQNIAVPTSSSSSSLMPLIAGKFKTAGRNKITCFAVQESSTSTAAAAETKEEVKEAPKAAAAETKEEVKEAPKAAAAETKEEVKEASKAAAAKKPPAKAPAKPLPEMMEEEVIPSLKEILEAQEDLSDIELVFRDNKLEGSFLKNGNRYSFWAFFPTGSVTGPKGFSLSSYNSGASTVEPFLVDEKKITSKHVVFWVEKRLAAQGIIPVWKE